MKIEELIALGLTEEQAAKVFAMNGKDVTAEKAKFADYGDIKEQLKTANDSAVLISSFISMLIATITLAIHTFRQKVNHFR